MIYLHKILPVFFLPVGLVLISIIAGILFKRRFFFFCALTILLLSSMPVTSNLLMRAVEGSSNTHLPAEMMPKADAIVVLSGGMKVMPNGSEVIEWSDPDRFFGGIELYKAGKAPLIIFTGGWVPWRSEFEPEGNILIRDALDLGVEPEHMVTTTKVSNTAEEAKAVSELIRSRLNLSTKPRIFLVTSAYHMRRAVLLFERADLNVTPFPVDFQVVEKGLSILDFIPGISSSMRQTDMALREVYGYLYYSIVR